MQLKTIVSLIRKFFMFSETFLLEQLKAVNIRNLHVQTFADLILR